MKPARHILDKSFVYTNAVTTDIRLTFERVRREMEAKAAKPTVMPIKREVRK